MSKPIPSAATSRSPSPDPELAFPLSDEECHAFDACATDIWIRTVWRTGEPSGTAPEAT